jgi:hypothetical protein
MRTTLGLLLLVCVNAPAALLLTVSDPNQTVAPDAHAIFHGTLLNTDLVAYNVVSFVMINPPTDATTPPTAAQLFPANEPAVPFHIAAGGGLTGVVVDFTVPITAQLRSHSFGVEAATDVHGSDGQTIVSNNVDASLTVATPEPNTAIPICLCLAGFCFTLARRMLESTVKNCEGD